MKSIIGLLFIGGLAAILFGYPSLVKTKAEELSKLLAHQQPNTYRCSGHRRISCAMQVAHQTVWVAQKPLDTHVQRL